MGRGKEKGLCIEEVSVPERLEGKTLGELNLGRHRELLLMAVREGEQREYNPEESLCVAGSSVLVFMGTPETRIQLEGEFKD